MAQLARCAVGGGGLAGSRPVLCCVATAARAAGAGGGARHRQSVTEPSEVGEVALAPRRLSESSLICHRRRGILRLRARGRGADAEGRATVQPTGSSSSYSSCQFVKLSACRALTSNNLLVLEYLASKQGTHFVFESLLEFRKHNIKAAPPAASDSSFLAMTSMVPFKTLPGV